MEAKVNEKLSDDTGEQMVQYYFDGKKWHQKWEKRFDASELVMTKQAQELEIIRQQVQGGKLSPLSYHIQANLFSIRLLSSYTGIPKRRIRKHLKPKYFNQLDDETQNKYASIFEITVDELKELSL
ncbi:MAG: hypothetical protein LBI45_06595 [Bacteroidales bacterium]|jgi:hypothetical protein|nr:hypothetical protein [Bacteroidales bacterium]